MITVISGTNRPSSNTLKIAHEVGMILEGIGEGYRLLDLGELPEGIFEAAAYAEAPAGFAPFQEAILEADGIVTVVPEYNGSFPGALKFFIDRLAFPESLYQKPAAFVGLAAGRWGALRAVEQLAMVFQYRSAHLYGQRVFIPQVNQVLDDGGRIADEELAGRLNVMIAGFVEFCCGRDNGR